jgi:hypothetical protein
VTKTKSTLLRAVFLLVVSVAAASWSAAQSTVFNIPSTDVQPHRSTYVELDFTAHLSSFESGGYQSYGPRVVYGLNKRMEVGLNAFYTHTSPVEPTEIQPNFKVQLYQNEERGLAVAAGTIAFLPVTQRSLSKPHAMIYSVLSKSFKPDLAPRFTVGAYGITGSLEPGTSRKGLLLGYEQPIVKRISFVADWSSGNNDYGYVVGGLGITMSKKSLLYIGYNVGNQGRANNSIGVYYGFNF